ncbi:putative Lysine methyltransferase [Monocercomonoides exilis]|uniref:putative Lysine methyltransferase n=1 Tax=Monocercomonoides exilis TaxID=2049356 RepID=UPI00355A92E8|nr:putative Lysine methyltransferase [Monocercomonoides exilis]|eukprot:MONOS_10820.1-p1 / transcript=MONOS_10820.1 / gene=MONOS_10820 / organism=Monocercomonoides_exilis_PA203 / gene_product=unspecified product / transcript_product=unspecified product / location=Mono_scaffold00507:39998-41419(-) / protein_length=433 / sequence_SO=supercontig / SO=protein_coding / is_pseudo=false
MSIPTAPPLIQETHKIKESSSPNEKDEKRDFKQQQQPTKKLSPFFQRAINSLQWRKSRCRDGCFSFLLKDEKKKKEAEIVIKQVPLCEMAGLGTGATVWDAAIALARWFELIANTETKSFSFSPPIKQSDALMKEIDKQATITPTTVPMTSSFKFSFSFNNQSRWIEIGSGHSFIGIVAKILGCGKVVCTDLDFLQFLMKDNIASNQHLWTNKEDELTVSPSNIKSESDDVSCTVFDWNADVIPENIVSHSLTKSPYQLVIVCECLYANVPHHLLLNALLLLTEPPNFKRVHIDNTDECKHSNEDNITEKETGASASTGTLNCKDEGLTSSSTSSSATPSDSSTPLQLTSSSSLTTTDSSSHHIINYPPSSFNPPFILIVYEHRNSIVFSDFMKSALPYFDVLMLPYEVQHPFYQTNDIFYYAMRRKTIDDSL